MSAVFEKKGYDWIFLNRMCGALVRPQLSPDFPSWQKFIEYQHVVMNKKEQVPALIIFYICQKQVKNNIGRNTKGSVLYFVTNLWVWLVHLQLFEGQVSI